jgi:hypothetical protein
MNDIPENDEILGLAEQINARWEAGVEGSG